MSNIQIQSLNNFINFLSLESNVSEEELDTVKQILSDNINRYNNNEKTLIEKAKNLLSFYYDRRLKKVKNLLFVLNDDTYTNTEKFLLAIRDYPFLDTINIDTEKSLFKKFYSSGNIDNNKNYNPLDLSELYCIFLNNISDSIENGLNTKDYNNSLKYLNALNTADVRTIQKNFFSVKKPTYEEIVDNYNNIGFVKNENEKNHIKGNYGELYVFNNEKNNLIKEGRPDLADRMIWVSHEIGDGFGYDILSFNPDGSLKPIEVKSYTNYRPKYKVILTNNEYEKFRTSPNYQVLVVELSTNLIYRPLFEDIISKDTFEIQKKASNRLL